jgi:predicted transcriptional regulator
MDKIKFNELLKKAGLSKKDFSKILGTTAGTVSNWGSSDREIPYWVESWLELYIDNIKFKTLKTAISESGACK